MIFKHFRINVLFRVLFLAGAVFVFLFALSKEDWFMTTLFAGLGVLLLTIELIRYVEKTNRDLQTFLLAIRHNDFTNTFYAGKRGKSYKGLSSAFNAVISEFQNLRAEKESHYQYLQTVIEAVGIAIICFDRNTGEVQLMNRAAQDLLGKPYLNNLEALDRTNPNLFKIIKGLHHGQRELAKVVVSHELQQLAIRGTEFKVQDQAFKLVSLQNIQSELEDQEIDSWQKLIRVLTHEIMNSVTPIISLTVAISEIMEDENGERMDLCDIETDDVEDMYKGIKTIQGRTRGMLHFVNAYRNLTRVPKPTFSLIKVEEMFGNIRTLLQPELERRNIDCEVLLRDPELEVQADGELIEQVLINLVKNAMEALEGRPHALISLSAGRNPDQRTLIQVQDNGPGIPDEFVNQIFIPFFTTKKKGSGIGLSLSRQIMQTHKGSISVQTDPDDGTLFTLVF